MKRALVISFALLSALSFASFELAIVTDQSTGFHRFDGQTGLYLGAFGAGSSSGVSSTWADQSTSTFYAMSSNGIRKWNYSTGENLGIVNFGASGGFATNDGAGNFYIADGSNVIKSYNLNGTDGSIAAPSGTAAQWVHWDNGQMFLGESSNGGRILRNSPGSPSWIIVAAGLGLAAIPATPRRATSLRYAGVPDYAKSIYTHTFTTSDRVFGFNSAGNYTNNNTLNLNPITFRQGSAPGHFGTYMVGYTANAGTTAIVYLDEFGANRSFTSTAVANPQALTIVLAPEPGTMLAIGAGLAFLAKRRKAN